MLSLRCPNDRVLDGTQGVEILDVDVQAEILDKGDRGEMRRDESRVLLVFVFLLRPLRVVPRIALRGLGAIQ